MREDVELISSVTWPEFLFHDAVTARYWDKLYDRFATFQLVICEAGKVVAIGNTIPVYWNGSLDGLPGGLDDVIEKGMRERGYQRPTALSALAAIVPAEHQGRALGTKVLRAMKGLAVIHGLGALIAPVRPSLKSSYPLVLMEEYVNWRREDYTRFDPWMRAHDRLGAEALCVAPRSMFVSGTIERWESWTGMDLSVSGEYVVPGALCPISVDCGRDLATYEEPNVWMCHPV